MEKNKILLVDDDEKLIKLLAPYFEQEQFIVFTASNGKEALQTLRQVQPDIMVLDLMMPVMDGFEVCRQVRKDNDIPIIFLSAKDSETDRLIGLTMGADDYVVKPFSMRELVARVKACLRRAKGKVIETTHAYHVQDLTIDTDKVSVLRDDTPIELTPTEFKVLHVLATSPGRVYSRLQLLEKVQDGYGVFEGYERTIDTHIRNLRKKLERDPSHPQYILTVYGIGYKFQGGTHA